MKKTTPKSAQSGLLIAPTIVVAIAAGLIVWYFYHRHPRIGGIRNVVLISIDTCRADRLSCYGYRRQTTPNIDAIARDGVLFNHALTPVPLTTPAHSSMLTGKYPPAHGLRMNEGRPLADSNVTLAEILRDAGYQTAAFVSGFPLDSRFGLNQGFDTYDCQFTKKKFKGSLRVEERRAEDVSRLALAWIEEHGGNPFFLFLHYFDPHVPYEPPPPYSAIFAHDLYAGEIAYVDHWIGLVMDRLRAIGAYDNTLVVITGDHGESLGEHGEATHSFFIYQSTLRVPLVIRAPHARQDLRVDDNASLVDIVPTILDLVALKAPRGMQGQTLRSSLEGRIAQDRRQPIYCESLVPATYDCGPLNGVVDSQWKYIRAPRQELYDMKADPGEQGNMMTKEPWLAGRLRSRLEAMLREMESAAPSGPSVVDPDAVRRLQSLGYVGGGTAPAKSVFDPTLEDPKDFRSTHERIMAVGFLIGVNRFKEAERELLDIAASRPRLITPYSLLAGIAVRERRLEDAVVYCERIISILVEAKESSAPIPDDVGDLTLEGMDARNLAAVHLSLGIMLNQLGKVPEAIGHYDQALLTSPNSSVIHFNLGVSLARAGKVPEAIGHYEQAIRIKPDYADAHLYLGGVLQQTGQMAEAVEHYEQGVRLKPDLVLALNNLAWIRATDDDPKLRDGTGAIRLAEHVCQLTSRKQAGLLDTLAAAYAEAGKFQEAVATAEDGIALAKAGGKSALADEIKGRLELYRAGNPYREPKRTMPVVGE